MTPRSNLKWANKLSRPIALRNGSRLHTLRDARMFVLELPRRRHSAQWETATARLVAAAESGNPDDIVLATWAVEIALRGDHDFPEDQE
jgi:hypothetical protein